MVAVLLWCFQPLAYRTMSKGSLSYVAVLVGVARLKTSRTFFLFVVSDYDGVLSCPRCVIGGQVVGA